MKKYLLLTVVASIFAAGSALANCGTCGAGHEKAGKADKAACAEACTASKKAECTADGKAACKAACTKPCDTTAKADETATSSAPACCPATKSSKPA